ncbi:hypothetical protein SCMU_03950 [Sinomonas cyclohexanicum]|uniref:Uncharacterized protein n=1 Tax=Sinomonas cyclohexanicum TaxID=322009 RepID=A0ABN6FCX1_SINCY|nr:hypothetical protein SCMU_03950 [Corynebacterium cyclohexanicum]
MRDGDVQRQDRLAERGLASRECRLVVRAGVVELGKHDGARHPHALTLGPQGDGRGVDVLGGRDDEQGAVRGAEPGAELAHEVGVAGGVEQVDLDVAGHDRGERERHGALLVDGGGVGIADCGAVRDGAHAGDRAGRGQDRLEQDRLARPRVAHEGHVAD